MPIALKRVSDYELTGDGTGGEWSLAHPLTRVGGSASFHTTVQAAYSDSGLYFLLHCEDDRLHCTGLPDGDDLYKEDVVELFLQPNVNLPLYLEYEISPLSNELVLLVCNTGRRFYGWQPFHYEGVRRTRRQTAVCGGEREPGARCRAWSAEIFLPYALLEGVLMAAPSDGDVWRGNVFRIDYGASESRWALDPACGTEFHRFDLFTEILFT